METGQKTIRQSSKIKDPDQKILSIQVSLNGLSFCVLDKQSNTIEYYHQKSFDKKQNPSRILDHLIDAFNSEKELQQDFDKINVIHENELSALVPESLFDKDQLADYLKFNSRILKTDFITYDLIGINNSVNVYVPYININNYLYDQFGEFEYRHFSTILLEQLLSLAKQSDSDTIYVHVGQGHFEIIVLNEKGLVLYNTFSFITKEDFIYYILFTLEQLQLNPETVELKLLGDITDQDPLYEMAYTYVRQVQIPDLPSEYTIESSAEGLLKNFIIQHSF